MKNGTCSAATVAGSAALPFVLSTGGVMGLRPTQGDESGSCSATTVAGSTALPFVLSTGAQRSGEICGVSGPSLGGRSQGDETGPVQQLLLLAAPPSPLSSRPERSWAFVPPKAMKNGPCSATTVAGSAALPFVSSTGAQRSGEICGVSGPSQGGRSQGDEKRVLFSNDCCWQRRPPLCHLDRSAA